MPSVVYFVWLRPEPVSDAERVTETGEDVYQPAEQAAPLHWIELEGRLESGVTVKETGFELRPALFWAVTLFGSAGSVGLPVWLYVAVPPATERDHPVAAAGNV